MKYILIAVFMAVLFLSCGTNRETVLDRVVTVHREIFLEIPSVSRLCEELGLEGDSVFVNKTFLYVETEGSGVPLVLLHGGPGATHHYFHPFFSRAAEFAMVIYYDQRGCGLSGYDAGDGYSTSQAVEDLECLRIALGFEEWIVLGHSYGGLLAQMYAQSYPENLAGLVLVCSATSLDLQLEGTREINYLTREERVRINEIANSEDLSIPQQLFNRQMNGDWKRQSFYRPSEEQIARLSLYEYQSDPLFRNRVLCDWFEFHADSTIAIFEISMLIVEGTWDLTWNTDKPQALHSQYPGAELVVFGESGHSPFEDQPGKFFDLLEDFCIECTQTD